MTQTCWNPEYALEKVDNDLTLLLDLLDIWNDQRDRLLHRIDEDLAEKNWSLVALTAHTLKGSLNVLTATDALESIENLERQLPLQDAAICRVAFDDLVENIASLQVEIDDWLTTVHSATCEPVMEAV